MSGDPQRAAIVTGGSRGIGAAISRRLAADGCAVVVNYAGRAEPAAETVAAIEAQGGRALAIQADVSDPAQAARLFQEAETAFGAVDVLVNSAGVMSLAPLAEVEDDAFDRIMDVNVKGVFNCLREAARRMPNGGRIVTLSSTVVAVGFPTYGVYTASKAAVEALTLILAKELRGRSITVNTVAPGPTATELFLKDKTAEQVAALAKANPLERLGEPDDIAGAVAMLVGPDGGWINGQTIRANGGMA